MMEQEAGHMIGQEVDCMMEREVDRKLEVGHMIEQGVDRKLKFGHMMEQEVGHMMDQPMHRGLFALQREQLHFPLAEEGGIH